MASKTWERGHLQLVAEGGKPFLPPYEPKPPSELPDPAKVTVLPGAVQLAGDDRCAIPPF